MMLFQSLESGVRPMGRPVSMAGRFCGQQNTQHGAQLLIVAIGEDRRLQVTGKRDSKAATHICRKASTFRWLRAVRIRSGSEAS